MDKYRKFVEESANGPKPSSVIRNRSREHASVIFENIFRCATSNVHILTGEMNPDVYGTPNVIQESIKFLRRNEHATIEILIEKKIDFESHPWFLAVAEHELLSQVSVSLVPEDVYKKYDCHFSVADSAHFRLEPDKNSCEAFAQFGDSTLAPKMEAVFVKIKKNSISETLGAMQYDREYSC